MAQAVRPSPPRRLPPLSPRVALLASAAVVLGVVLYAGRAALGPFIVGLLLVYLMTPAIEFLVRLRAPRSVAILLVYAVTVILVFEALNVMLRPLIDQIRQFATDLPTLIDRLQAELQRLGAVYRGLQLPPAIRDAVDAWVAQLRSGEISFDPSVLLPVLQATTGFLGAILAFLLVPVWSFYLLKDRPDLLRSADEAIPAEWRADIHAVMAIVDRVFGSWIRGQLILGLTVGIATFVGLLFLGAVVDPIFARFAVLLAVIAGILELLPIIGPIIAAIPAILLAATAGIQAAIAALILYTVVQQVENNLLVPKIQGDATNLHPSVVMLALVVGGALGGLLGAILALPVTAAARDTYAYLFSRLGTVADRPRSTPPATAVSVPATAASVPAAAGAAVDGGRDVT